MKKNRRENFGVQQVPTDLVWGMERKGFGNPNWTRKRGAESGELVNINHSLLIMHDPMRRNCANACGTNRASTPIANFQLLEAFKQGINLHVFGCKCFVLNNGVVPQNFPSYFYSRNAHLGL